MSWMSNYKLRMIIGGIIVLAIGLIVLFVTGKTILLFVPVIGAVFLVIGIAWYLRVKQAAKSKQPVGSKPAK
ncbi:MAG TPA: hypothetical protein VKM55_27175 [Candidatus Lokiarchaeia archaeon]|nr:hypothetical protein [Candidatus Lokiarchaeia archaeon]